ncbi:hypothetical protein EsH8_VI_000981 [Colletotrichum jinshuiense]
MSVESSKPLGRIAFIGTGGTVASKGDDEYDILDYNANGQRFGAEVVINETGVKNLAEVEIVSFSPIDSTAITPNHWHDLAERCCALAKDSSIRGIVIGHGTASLEETAWALSLVLDLDIPVVVTGSMRPLNGISSDATANLTAAFRVAAHPFPAGEKHGVMVVFNDEIHSPRAVTKSHTLRLGAFQSPWLGPIGYVDGDNVNLTAKRKTSTSAQFSHHLLRDMPRVDVVYSYVGADGTAVEAFVQAGAKGIISAGFGPGLGAPQEIEAFRNAISKGVTVVQSSRLGAGTVVDSAHHKGLKIIAGSDLNPQKARILLSLCLARQDGRRKIESVFSSV